MVLKQLKTKKQKKKGRFVSMLLGTFGACLLENMLKEKTVQKGKEQLDQGRIFTTPSSFN